MSGLSSIWVAARHFLCSFHQKAKSESLFQPGSAFRAGSLLCKLPFTWQYLCKTFSILLVAQQLANIQDQIERRCLYCAKWILRKTRTIFQQVFTPHIAFQAVIIAKNGLFYCKLSCNFSGGDHCTIRCKLCWYKKCVILCRVYKACNNDVNKQRCKYE